MNLGALYLAIWLCIALFMSGISDGFATWFILMIPASIIETLFFIAFAGRVT